MGALAPVSSWNPEDDLLLKNAVEAGASLESLAKGAVQFSRRYTVRELQERWHSLLYDPVVSAEACDRMIEFERVASTNPSKLSKFGNLKENKCMPGKRRSGSVRNCYYALRKRICNEPFNPTNVNFFVAPSNSNYGNDQEEPLTGNCMLGEDPISSHFELLDSDMEIIQRAFPEIMMDGSLSSVEANVCHVLEKEIHNAPESLNPMEEDLPRANPGKSEENLSLPRKGSQDEELCQSNILQECSVFAADGFGPKPLSACTQANHDGVNICSTIGQSHAFDSPILDCSVSFHNLECSSPFPVTPIWKSVEGSPMPAMPVDMSITGKDFCSEDAFTVHNNTDAKYAGTSGQDVRSTSCLNSAVQTDEMKASTPCTEGYLEELSKTLLNFTNEEELLYIDIDGKDGIDKSYYDGLSSLLLNSPLESNQDNIPSVNKVVTSVSADAHLLNVSPMCPVDAYKDENIRAPGIASSSDVQFPEICDGFTFCALNTEDPEIPCNDDVCIPKELTKSVAPPRSQRKFHETNGFSSTSVKECAVNQRTLERVPGSIQRENHGQYHAPGQRIGSQVLVETCPKQSISYRATKSELANCDTSGTTAPGVTDRMDSTVVGTECIPGASMKEAQAEFSLEPNALGTLRDDQSLMAEVVSTDLAVQEQVTGMNCSASDIIESDDDVPYCSDIEAMILDMDLDPEGQNLLSNDKVLRYQFEETRRAIIRLEQEAYSYMQRAIASHGAFAVLYGRHSKHFIKKSEVLLGRGTADFSVDIDLGREGRFNKISRRQAIIKLESGGSFLLKNLGKCVISVNNMEVAPGLSLSLSSSCLIEVRGMPFIFETNQSCVKQYLDGLTEK